MMVIKIIKLIRFILAHTAKKAHIVRFFVV